MGALEVPWVKLEMKTDIHAVNPHDSLFDMIARGDDSAADKLIEDAKAGKQIRVL